jgi:UDP-N-acetylglucosamine acyltransferase
MIHPTAIVETSGTLSENIEIGPYAILMGDINVASGCRIEAHAQLINQVSLGEKCAVGAGSVIGGDPQDLSFDSNTVSGVTLENNNTLRENITIHRSSTAGGVTRLGHDNYLKAGVHLGHDVRLGDHNVLGNDVLLGGHITVGNHTRFGSGSACHQFVRIGHLTYIYPLGSLSLDLPPFVALKNLNNLVGLNHDGLREANLSNSVLDEINQVYNLLIDGNLNRSQGLAAADEIEWQSQEARDFIDFFKADSIKGICTMAKK